MLEGLLAQTGQPEAGEDHHAEASDQVKPERVLIEGPTLQRGGRVPILIKRIKRA